MVDLGTLGGIFINSAASDVNSKGQVVGYSGNFTNGNFVAHAVFWQPN